MPYPEDMDEADKKSETSLYSWHPPTLGILQKKQRPK